MKFHKYIHFSDESHFIIAYASHMQKLYETTRHLLFICLRIFLAAAEDITCINRLAQSILASPTKQEPQHMGLKCLNNKTP